MRPLRKAQLHYAALDAFVCVILSKYSKNNGALIEMMKKNNELENKKTEKQQVGEKNSNNAISSNTNDKKTSKFEEENKKELVEKNKDTPNGSKIPNNSHQEKSDQKTKEEEKYNNESSNTEINCEKLINDKEITKLIEKGSQWYDIEDKFYGNPDMLLSLADYLVKQNDEKTAWSIILRNNLKVSEDYFKRKFNKDIIIQNPLDAEDSFNPVLEICNLKKSGTYLNMKDFGFSEQDVFVIDYLNNEDFKIALEEIKRSNIVGQTFK